MQRETEIELLKELLGLHERKSAFLADNLEQRPVTDYFDEPRFQQEQDRVLRASLQPAVHSSELAKPGDFLRRDFAGLPLLFTRDKDGEVHAFLNVCRHRGTRLVDDAKGCKGRFSCPYHAWTWNNRGELLAIPHSEQGFSALDRKALGLKPLACIEQHGWLWVTAANTAAPDVDASLAGLAEDFAWFDPAAHCVAHSDEFTANANWKILVEGGIEAYHFRIAHRNTIAPYFLDNLSSYRMFGPHMRSVLARRTLPGLLDQPEDSWRIRDHAQVLYSVFPLNQFLVQSDHFAWIQMVPLNAAQTRVRVSTMAPADRLELDEDLRHWAKNHEITMATLAEDFVIGESIQSGLESGANTHLTFGRFEGALADFNRSVDAQL
ncbi:MAG: SRPBCC family protein [Pseudomonadota bacterium]